MKRILNLSPEARKALTASCKDLFNPSPEYAAWMKANLPTQDEIMATLKDYYLREAATDGRVH